MKKVIQYKTSDLVYYVYGSGKPLVLLHGFAETNAVWNKQVKYLSDFCKLIIPDLPGSGESKPLDINIVNTTVDDFADAINAILINAKLNKCMMLGHSFGGYITLAFAEKYPEKLRAFGFVNSTAFADSEEKKQNRLKAIEMINTYGSYAFIKSTTPSLFAVDYKMHHSKKIDDLIEDGKKFEPENLMQYYYAMINRPDRTVVLKESKVPVLFVMGTEDAAAPMCDVLKQVHIPKIAYIHILKNVAHMGMWEATENVNQVLRNFENEV